MSIPEDTIKGVIVGGLIGGALSFFSSMMKIKEQTANKLDENMGFETLWLKADTELCEVVSRYREIAGYGEESFQLYVNVVKNCDQLVELVHNDSRKTRAIHANRCFVAAKTSATALCRLAISKGSDRAHELLRDIDLLNDLLNNHLHNIMVS